MTKRTQIPASTRYGGFSPHSRSSWFARKALPPLQFLCPGKGVAIMALWRLVLQAAITIYSEFGKRSKNKIGKQGTRCCVARKLQVVLQRLPLLRVLAWLSLHRPHRTRGNAGRGWVVSPNWVRTAFAVDFGARTCWPWFEHHLFHKPKLQNVIRFPYGISLG